MAELSRANVFADFQSKRAHHEDRLTRAFIVVLRLVPAAHEAFLRLVRAARGAEQPELPDLWSLSAAASEVIYDSQRQSLGCVAERLLSVLLTDERPKEPIAVARSERTAVYDGVLGFPPQWVLTVENKPSSKNVWNGQLSPGKDAEVDEIEAQAAVVTWKDLIRAWTSVLHSELGSAAEASILQDFLALVQTLFPDLQPYHTLSLCNDHVPLLNERCRWIMEEITPGHVGYHHGWKHFMHFAEGIAKQVALDADASEGREASIVLSIHPGDVMSKAKALYANLNADALLRLAAAPGWHVRPNFHIAYRASNLYHATTRASLGDYVGHWRTHAQSLAQIPIATEAEKASFRQQLDEWVRLGFVGPEETRRMLEVTVETRRHAINVCPGISLFHRWPLAEACRLDDAGHFAAQVRGRLEDALALWQQALAAPPEA